MERVDDILRIVSINAIKITQTNVDRLKCACNSSTGCLYYSNNGSNNGKEA